MVGNNVRFIGCSCSGKNESLSPNTTRYSPLLNDGQEKPSSAMQNWQWHKNYAYAQKNNKAINNFYFSL